MLDKLQVQIVCWRNFYQQALMWTVTPLLQWKQPLVWLGSAITSPVGFLCIFYIVFPANLDSHIAGLLRRWCIAAASRWVWASEEALQLQSLSLWQRSTHRRTAENLFQHNRRRASALYQLCLPPQREWSVRSQRRGTKLAEKRGGRGVRGILADAHLSLPLSFTLCLSLSLSELCSSPISSRGRELRVSMLRH